MIKRIPVIILAVITFSCISTGKIKILYEGFEGNKLTVFISEFIPEKKQTEAQLSTLLQEKLNQRAFIILACYVSININRSKVSSPNDQMLNDTINSAIAHGAIIQYSFNEEGYCEAFAEYELSGFFKVIDEINNQ